MCAGAAQYARIQHAADDAARDELKRQHGGDIPPQTPDPADGRDTYLRLMSPNEPTPQARGGARGHQT